MKYVFRLSNDVKAKLDLVAPPRQHGRSKFIREALVGFLCKPKQSLADRPHLRGREKAYKQVCAILDQEQTDVIKNAYPDVSISVVIQAAVVSELRKARYKIVGLPDGKPTTGKSTKDDKKQNTDAYPRSRIPSRKLAAAVDQP